MYKTNFSMTSGFIHFSDENPGNLVKYFIVICIIILRNSIKTSKADSKFWYTNLLF